MKKTPMENVLETTRQRMAKAIVVVREDLATIRSGRAIPALVEHITIAAYGGSQRLKVKELATITTQDAKTLLVTPYDPSIVGEIEKGLFEANVGLTPVVDRAVIRISIPPLSEERRREYIKLAKTKLEAGRIMIRQVRQEGMKDLKRLVDGKTISEDQKKHGEKMIQDLTDEMTAEIDALGEKKEAELFHV